MTFQVKIHGLIRAFSFASSSNVSKAVCFLLPFSCRPARPAATRFPGNISKVLNCTSGLLYESRLQGIT